MQTQQRRTHFSTFQGNAESFLLHLLTVVLCSKKVEHKAGVRQNNTDSASLPSKRRNRVRVVELQGLCAIMVLSLEFCGRRARHLRESFRVVRIVPCLWAIVRVFIIESMENLYALIAGTKRDLAVQPDLSAAHHTKRIGKTAHLQTVKAPFSLSRGATPEHSAAPILRRQLFEDDQPPGALFFCSFGRRPDMACSCRRCNRSKVCGACRRGLRSLRQAGLHSVGLASLLRTLVVSHISFSARMHLYNRTNFPIRMNFCRRWAWRRNQRRRR